MFNNYTTIPTDYVIAYYLDGNGNSTTGTNNATVTNGTWIKSDKLYQAQCLSWGASTSLTYTSVTYTNSYIWIYASGVWTFTKNSSKVTATALNGVNGERYAGLKFYNRTLTEEEIRNLYLEGQRQLGNGGSYPGLLSGLVGYWDFRGDAYNLVDGVKGTVTGATLTQDRFGNSNSAYYFNGNSYINNIIPTMSQYPITIAFYFRPTNSVSSSIYSKAFMLSTSSSSSTESIDFSYDHLSSSFRQSFSVRNSVGTWINASTTTNFVGGQTYFMSCTFDGVNLKAYVNGILEGTSGAFSGTNVNIGYLSIGANQTNGDKINAVIETPIILNRTLSANEVKALYDLTSQDYIYPSKVYDLPNLRDGLVLDLDSNGKDLSGNGNHGTLVNSPALVRQGRAKGLSYNGSNTRVDIPTSSSLNFGTGNFTFNFFGKFNTLNTYDAILNKYRSSPTNVGWTINSGTTNPTACYLYLYNSGAGGVCQSNSGFLDLGKTNMYTIIRRGSNVDFYKNGLFFQTVSGYGIDISNNYSMGIGDYNYTGSLDGNIFNPKIYNRVLSAKEIQQLYYSQKGSFIY